MKNDNARPLPARLSSLWVGLLALSILVRTFLTWFRHFNADEFQHLHAAWMIHLGYLPYQDFWENHAPLLYYALAHILSIFKEGPPAVHIARMLLSAAGLLILVVVYKIALHAFDRKIALLSVVLLSISEIYIQKTIEVRPDQLLVLCWLLSIWWCLKGLAHNKGSEFWLAGIFLGSGFLFSPKALVCLPAIVLMLFPWRKGFPLIRKSLRSNLQFCCGFIIPPVFLSIVLHANGIWTGWLEQTIWNNLSYPDLRGPTFLLLPQNLSLLILAGAGMVWTLKDRDHDIAQHAVVLMIPALIMFLILVFLLPSVFSQSGLLFVPLFAIYAAFAFSKAFESGSPVVRVLVVLLAIVIPSASLFFRVISGPSNREQIQLMKYVLQRTSRDEPVFDGNAAYVFREQAYYYGSLVEAVRYQLKQKAISIDIPESLRRQRCRVVIFDDRVRDLPEGVQNFIRNNYLLSEHDDVYIAGFDISPEKLSGKKAVLRIEIPAVYAIEAQGGKNLQVDGEPYDQPLFLHHGTHEVSSDADLRRVIVRSIR